MVIQFGWLAAFSGCYFIQRALEYTGISGNYSNIFSCIVFQFYISTKALALILFGNISNENTLLVLHNLYGYFIYDLAILVFHDYTPNKKMYIIHHTVSCLLINTLITNKNWSNFYGILFIFLTESTGPFTNLNIVLKNHPNLRILNLKITKYYFMISRILLLPIVAINFMNNFIVEKTIFYTVYSTFAMIYAMNINWAIKLFNKDH